MDHFPVLLSESIEYLAIRPDGTYVDATCGLGGHTASIARRLTSGRVIALDRDAESLELAKTRTADCADRITFRQSAFSQLRETLLALGVGPVHGILGDLGVNRVQLTSGDRGFSLQERGPLDMRLDRGQPRTAYQLVNHSSEKELAGLFYHLGDERRHSRKIARAMVRARPIRDTLHLAEVVESVVPRTGRIHPATRVFQSIRMAVNDEPQELQAFLDSAPRLLAAEGRLVVIAFHSNDDRAVKRAFQALGRSGEFRILTKHVVKPGLEEIRVNPPSRSAVLRALERRRLDSVSGGGKAIGE
ncbi:MAG: 16S rRNA (cytosine(1402)-N(4))-methyltransferase RsmH [Bryobacterales bacterium]|nr:16S rRNA (cytosine(1402)-N(4))-methyltransferase RsmH [Bryobacterales bacterium]